MWQSEIRLSQLISYRGQISESKKTAISQIQTDFLYRMAKRTQGGKNLIPTITIAVDIKTNFEKLYYYSTIEKKVNIVNNLTDDEKNSLKSFLIDEAESVTFAIEGVTYTFKGMSNTFNKPTNKPEWINMKSVLESYMKSVLESELTKAAKEHVSFDDFYAKTYWDHISSGLNARTNADYKQLYIMLAPPGSGKTHVLKTIGSEIMPNFHGVTIDPDLARNFSQYYNKGLSGQLAQLCLPKGLLTKYPFKNPISGMAMDGYMYDSRFVTVDVVSLLGFKNNMNMWNRIVVQFGQDLMNGEKLCPKQDEKYIRPENRKIDDKNNTEANYRQLLSRVMTTLSNEQLTSFRNPDELRFYIDILSKRPNSLKKSVFQLAVESNLDVIYDSACNDPTFCGYLGCTNANCLLGYFPVRTFIAVYTPYDQIVRPENMDHRERTEGRGIGTSVIKSQFDALFVTNQLKDGGKPGKFTFKIGKFNKIRSNDNFTIVCNDTSLKKPIFIDLSKPDKDEVQLQYTNDSISLIDG